MCKLELPRSSIEDAGEALAIRHNQTGVVVRVSRARLDAWCIAKLRELMSSPEVPAVKLPPEPEDAA